MNIRKPREFSYKHPARWETTHPPQDKYLTPKGAITQVDDSHLTHLLNQILYPTLPQIIDQTFYPSYPQNK